MNTSSLKTKLMREISLVPENRLHDLYKIVCPFRSQAAPRKEIREAQIYHDLDYLSGRWSEQVFQQIQGKIDSERITDEELCK